MATIVRNWAVINRSRPKNNLNEPLANAAVYMKGLKFGSWIDTSGGARSNGYNEGDLIRNPAYVIESLLRDWVFAEWNLRVDTASTTSTIEIDGSVNKRPLASTTDGYYTNAIYYNHTTNHRTVISDYDGISLYLTDADASVSAGDWVSITNIQGDNLIDTASFDAVGNTTNGIRNGYYCDISINDFISPRDAINIVCENYLMFLTKSGRKYKLFTLEKKATADGTFSNPLKVQGRPDISAWVQSIDSLYNDFSFGHNKQYARNEFLYKMTCTGTGSTSGLGSAYETLCTEITTKYRLGQRKLEREFPCIQDGMHELPTTTTTMHSVAKKLINFYTKLRLMVDYHGDFKTHMVYEPGDQIKINFPSAIPTGLNNSAFFIITNKQIESVNGIPTVRFQLMQTDTL